MTHEWLQTRVDEKFRTQWLDASWFSLVPELYGVNVAVWEPTGKGREAQLYKKFTSMWGLYPFDKQMKHDEEGHLWVHLLYRSGSSWTARVEIQGSGGTDSLNHFDCLELGTDVGGAFDDAISAFREYGGGGGEGDGDISPPPSPMPGKRRGAAGSAEETALKPRTSTQKSQPEADRGPQAQPKRKRAAKSKRGSKTRKGKGKSGGGGAAGSTQEANYDSDGSIGGDMDWTHQGSRGALPSSTKSQQLLRRKLSHIPEPAYKKAFRRTSLMKAKGEKVHSAMCPVLLPCSSVFYFSLLRFDDRAVLFVRGTYFFSVPAWRIMFSVPCCSRVVFFFLVVVLRLFCSCFVSSSRVSRIQSMSPVYSHVLLWSCFL